MEETVAVVSPAVEFDAELHRAVGGLHHLGRAGPDVAEIVADAGHGRLADTDRAERAGFDHGDRDRMPLEPPGQRRRRHPAGGAAARDDDRSYRPGLSHARPSSQQTP